MDYFNSNFFFKQEMERRNIQLPPYVDAEIIDTVSSLPFFLNVNGIGSHSWCFPLVLSL